MYKHLTIYYGQNLLCLDLGSFIKVLNWHHYLKTIDEKS